MDKNRFLNILPFVVWFPLLLLLGVTSQMIGNLYYPFALSVTFYMAFVPIIIVKRVEKQSVIKRLGLQSGRLKILAVLLAISTLAAFDTGNDLWSSLLSVVLAPIPEEIFFRGYIQGRFTMGGLPEILRMGSWKRILASTVGLIFVSSTVFAATHVFRYSLMESLPILLLGVVLGVIFLLTRSILLPAAYHAGYNFYITLNAKYVSPIPVLFWIVLIIFPSILLLIAELLKKIHMKNLKERLPIMDLASSKISGSP